jgi:hypothetical protein
MGSAVNGVSIVVSFVTLEAWKESRWLSWSSFRKLGLYNPVEDSTAYIRWLFNGLSSRWCLDCGLVRNSWSVKEPLAQLEFIEDKDSTAYIRWLFNGLISQWSLDFGLVRNS